MGPFSVTVVAVPHALLPSDPLLATRFYTGDPNDPKDGIGWFADGEWAFDYDFDGVADLTTTFGQAGDLPVVGDFNGDGRSRDRCDDAVRRRQHVDARHQRQRCKRRR